MPEHESSDDEIPVGDTTAAAATAAGPAPREPSCWTPQRLELLDGFKRKAAHLASLYEAGVTLFHDPAFPARYYLVAHAVREIGNRLPDAVGVQVENTRIDANRLNSVVAIWRRDGLPNDFATPIVAARAPTDPAEGIWLPKRTGEAVVELVRDHARSWEARQEMPIRLLQELARDTGMTVDQLRPIALQWVQVLRWFQTKVHAGSRERTISEDDFKRHFEIFEQQLGSMLRPFFSTLKEINDFLDEANR